MKDVYIKETGDFLQNVTPKNEDLFRDVLFSDSKRRFTENYTRRSKNFQLPKPPFKDTIFKPSSGSQRLMFTLRMFLMSIWSESVRPWLGRLTAGCVQEAKKLPKLHHPEKSSQNWGIWNFFESPVTQTLTFWHIILSPQTTMHIILLIIKKRQQKKKKSVASYIA